MTGRSDGHYPRWLAERLEAVDSDAFPVVGSPLRPVLERRDPWEVDPGQQDLGAVVDRVDVPAEGGGQILLVTDVEDDPVGRVQAAVLLARALVQRRRRVLLVDADVRHVGLSRWFEDADVDAEGLVDILQYGASIHSARRPSSVEGVDCIGIGSYRPDGSGLFIDAELRRFVQLLRAEAEVVVLICPAWLPDDRFHPLLVHADAVIPAIHMDRDLGSPVEDLLEFLTGLNIPILGLLTFAGPDDTERQVDAVLGGGAAAAAPGLDPEPAEPLEEAREDEPSAVPVDEAFEDERDPSSPIFRWAVAMSIIALVGFVGWWATTQRSDEPRVPRIERPATRVALPTANDPDTTRVVVADAEAETLAVASDLLPEATSTPTSEVAPDPEPEVERDDIASEDLADASAEETVVEPPVVAETPDTDDPLRRPIGEGWALYFYSFDDSLDAERSAASLASTGWSRGVRGYDIEGRGRWFRVLIGRFENRGEAIAKSDVVSEELDLDWVGVARVRR